MISYKISMTYLPKGVLMINSFYIYVLAAMGLAHFSMEISKLFNKRNTFASGLILAFIFYFSLNPISGVSLLQIAKHFIFIWVVFRALQPYLPQNKYNVIVSSLMGTLILISWFVQHIFPFGTLFLNILLLIGTLSYVLVTYKKNQIRDAFHMEAAVIFALGMLLICLTKDPVTVQLGIVLLALSQLIEMLGMKKIESMSFIETKHRLDLLETKFSRAVQIEAKRLSLPLNDQIHEIHRKTLKDNLTKVENREGLSRVINQCIVDKNIKIFSIALFDIDYFKQINDNQGHVKGDEALKNLVAILTQHLNRAFTLGRYGGDEFVIVMPNINAPKAYEIMKELCRQVALTGITISAGIATAPFDGKSQSDLFNMADKGLYKSKELGRNQVQYTGNVPLIK